MVSIAASQLQSHKYDPELVFLSEWNFCSHHFLVGSLIASKNMAVDGLMKINYPYMRVSGKWINSKGGGV